MTVQLKNTADQPGLVSLSPVHVNADNYIAKQLVKAWPQPGSTWQSAVVAMQQVYAYNIPWNQCCFTAAAAGTYQMTVRFFYWD